MSATLRNRGVSIDPGAITLARTAGPYSVAIWRIERDESGLRGAVRRVALGSDEPEDRRGADDARVPGLDEVGECGPTRPEHRVEVRRHREVPVVLARVDEPARHLHRGVVVEDVEPSEVVDRDLHHGVAVGPPGDVRVHGDPAAPGRVDLADRLAGAVIVEVGNDDPCALVREQRGLRRGPDPTRRR